MNKLKTSKKFNLTTHYVVRVAVMAGMLTALKFALSFVPNVEVVTLLILVYASAFGLAYALPATVIFCIAETAIYGAGSWVPLYFLYWPLLALFASVVLKKHGLWAAILLAAVMTMFFGVLAACADTLFCVVNLTKEQLGVYWVAYYLRGLPFDCTHLLSSVLTVGFLYLPLLAVAKKMSHKKENSPINNGKRHYARGARAHNTIYNKNYINNNPNIFSEYESSECETVTDGYLPECSESVGREV